jgi:hypothetical protein
MLLRSGASHNLDVNSKFSLKGVCRTQVNTPEVHRRIGTTTHACDDPHVGPIPAEAGSMEARRGRGRPRRGRRPPIGESGDEGCVSRRRAPREAFAVSPAYRARPRYRRALPSSLVQQGCSSRVQFINTPSRRRGAPSSALRCWLPVLIRRLRLLTDEQFHSVPEVDLASRRAMSSGLARDARLEPNLARLPAGGSIAVVLGRGANHFDAIEAVWPDGNGSGAPLAVVSLSHCFHGVEVDAAPSASARLARPTGASYASPSYRRSGLVRLII